MGVSRSCQYRPVAEPWAEAAQGVDALAKAGARGVEGGEDHRELDEAGRWRWARRPGDDVAREDCEQARPGGRRAARGGDRVERVPSVGVRARRAGADLAHGAQRDPGPPARRLRGPPGSWSAAAPVGGRQRGRAGVGRAHRGSTATGASGGEAGGSTGTTSGAAGTAGRVASSFWGPAAPAASGRLGIAGSTIGWDRFGRRLRARRRGRVGRARRGGAPAGGPRARVEEPAPGGGLDHRRRRRGVAGVGRAVGRGRLGPRRGRLAGSGRRLLTAGAGLSVTAAVWADAIAGTTSSSRIPTARAPSATRWRACSMRAGSSGGQLFHRSREDGREDP